MIPTSALYIGNVVHRRLRPRRHRLRYRCFWLLLDLDTLEETARRLRCLSLGRFNLFSLRNEDYGTGSDTPIRTQAERHLVAAGQDVQGAKIFLLTMPRVLGYGFNPLSVYYCFARDGSLAAMIYEVHNTFGQRHSYVIPAPFSSDPIHQACTKGFYVSPFLDMGLAYDFAVTSPRDSVSVAVRVSDDAGLLLAASLAGSRHELTDTALAKAFVSHPLLTLKVIAAIHWEALRLWWKGNALVARPEPPQAPATIVSTSPNTKALHE